MAILESGFSNEVSGTLTGVVEPERAVQEVYCGTSNDVIMRTNHASRTNAFSEQTSLNIGADFIPTVAIDSDNALLYWNERPGSTYEGINVYDIAAGTYQTWIDTTKSLRSLVHYEGTNYYVLSQSGTSEIWKAGLDATGQTLLYSAGGGIGVMDRLRDYLYFVETDASALRKLHIGTGVVSDVLVDGALAPIAGVGIDRKDHKIYFRAGSTTNRDLWRCNADGIGLEEAFVFTVPTRQFCIAGWERSLFVDYGCGNLLLYLYNLDTKELLDSGIESHCKYGLGIYKPTV